MPGTELHLLRETTVVRVVPVGEEPVSIGRDLGNTVTLLDEDVSAHHAIVVEGPSGLEVRDLRSKNGTFVNGERIEGSAILADGDDLRFGETARFVTCLTATTDRPTMILEHLTAGTAHLLDDERYRIGVHPRCNLVLPANSGGKATLIAHANGEVWLGDEAGERALDLNETFDVGSHRFRLVRAPEATSSTVWGCREARYSYRLVVGVDPVKGLFARLLDPAAGGSHDLQAENRIALLVALGRQLAADQARGLAASDAGWLHDEDALIAVWGRAGFRNAASTFSVLLHRTRKEIEQAGFDPWFVEKRRGAVRLRLRHVDLVEGGV